MCPRYSRGRGSPTGSVNKGNTIPFHFSSSQFKSQLDLCWSLPYPPCISLIHLEVALMTDKSPLHCCFHAVSLRNEANSFKEGRGALWSVSNFTFPMDERKVITCVKIIVTQSTVTGYFVDSSFSIMHLTCISHKHSIDSYLMRFLQLFAFLSLSWLPESSYLNSIFRYSNLLEFFSWHIHLSTFFYYFWKFFAHILSTSCIWHF